MEVMAAKMAGHIHDLANEIQVWPFQYCHGLGGELAGINAPQGDFCGFPNTFLMLSIFLCATHSNPSYALVMGRSVYCNGVSPNI